MDRITTKFDELRQKNQSAFVAFITAGDPDLATSTAIMQAMPENGVDIIELGMPFSDPMADGPAIQASALRALQNGHNMHKTLQMVQEFRKKNQSTPIILMGYFNPIYIYGVEKFCQDCQNYGVDGLIIVDLPPEEDADLFQPASNHGLKIIRLLAPTSDDARIPIILEHASGFVYYISVLGVTGKRDIDLNAVQENLARIRKHTQYPICVGFGITNADQAGAVAKIADGVVVGSAIVREIAINFAQNAPSDVIIQACLAKIRAISAGVK